MAQLHSALATQAPVIPSSAGVLSALRHAIIRGYVRPGTPIPLGQVAAFFGVSHIPIREALATLGSEGLVDHQHQYGYRVAQLTASDLRELYLARETLELALLARCTEHATAADEARLQQIVTDSATADGSVYQRLSRQFHINLVRPARMPRLLRMVEETWNITEPVQPMAHIDAAMRHQLSEDHLALLAAFRARDTDALIDRMTVHHNRINAAIAEIDPASGLVDENLSAR